MTLVRWRPTHSALRPWWVLDRLFDDQLWGSRLTPFAHDGVLEVRMPKAEETAERKTEIE